MIKPGEQAPAKLIMQQHQRDALAELETKTRWNDCQRHDEGKFDHLSNKTNNMTSTTTSGILTAMRGGQVFDIEGKDSFIEEIELRPTI